MEDNRKLKGSGLNIINDMFDSLNKACEDKVSKDDNLCIMHDLESGMPYVATKEYRDKFLALWESCKPDATNFKPLGKIIYFGTKGKMENDHDYGFGDLD